MGYLGYKPADKPLTSADITDSIITSAKIVDGTIVNADINASAAIASTKISGLSSDFVRLSTVTISSPVTSVNFDSSIVTGYLYYQIRFCNIGVSNDADDIGIRLSVDNGSNFATIQAVRAYPQSLDDGTDYNVSSKGTYSYHLLAEDAEATESTDGTSGGIVDIFGANSANHKHMISHSYTKNQNGGYYTYWTVSRVQTTSAINYISLYNLNNNLDAGTVTLYGVKNS